MKRISVVALFVGVVFALGVYLNLAASKLRDEQVVEWTPKEKGMLAKMQITDNLGQSIQATGNRWAEHESAARFGQKLFFDKRLSRSGDLACATCHAPDRYFTDGKKLPVAGDHIGERNTPTIVGAALSSWQFWDGRADSLWSQALGPLENQNEQANNRTNIVHTIREYYINEYESVFGPLPNIDFYQLARHASPQSPAVDERANWSNMTDTERDAINRVFTNLGKAIAAYESKLIPAPGKFDAYIQAVLDDDVVKQNTIYNRTEQFGLKLFLSEKGGRCANCHNGPMLTNFDFQAIAVPPVPSQGGDLGRILAAPLVDSNEFNCMSPYSDADTQQGDCAETQYTKITGIELVGAFKVPSLRNIKKTAPYMHKGQLKNLGQVLQYYNRAPQEMSAHSEIEPLSLLPAELKSIEAFLRTLDSDIAVDKTWLEAPKGDTNNFYNPLVSWMARR